jgi:hypothetical protein
MSEAGEHADAVDNAAANLKASRRGGVRDFALNENGAKLIERKIKLANGLEISPGDVSALMGDFYGAYTKGKDGKDHFDPAASFAALDNADPLEMAQLLSYVHEEKKGVQTAKEGKGTFEHTNNALFEMATASRNETTDANGTTTGYSFLDLAQKNTSHFGAPNEKNLDGTPNTDSHMGAYTQLHTMAISAAQFASTLPAGSRERADAENRALALEASSQHFLVDGFAGGHQFNKGQAVSDNGGGVGGNIHARDAHNDGNDNGVLVHNRRGEMWNAKGDSHWADSDNITNRGHASEAVLDSYGDIDDILTNRKTAADFVDDPAATAHERVPMWDSNRNRRTQEKTKEKGMAQLLGENIGEIALLPATLMRNANKYWKKAWSAIGGDSPAPPTKQEAEDHPIDIVTFDDEGEVFTPPAPPSTKPPKKRAGARDHYKTHHHYTEDHPPVDVPHHVPAPGSAVDAYVPQGPQPAPLETTSPTPAPAPHPPRKRAVAH